MVSLISARWKTLDIHEKAIFEKMAKDDRIRYNNECNARDQQILARQEEARQKNAMIETNSRMRESTVSIIYLHFFSFFFPFLNFYFILIDESN